MPESRGAIVYDNWVAFNARSAGGGTSAGGDTMEHPLFTDVRLVDDAADGLGPYQLINALNEPDRHPELPGAFFRYSYYGESLHGPMDRTDFERYHGGSIEDEVAALVSLSLAARFKAGSASRWFKVGGDPKGRPWSIRQFKNDPSLVRPLHGPILPGFGGQRTLSNLPLLRRLAELTPAQSVALVGAARQYQEAVWAADSDPNLTWLLLVSAAEVAANQWRAESEAPIDRLRASKPEIESLLIEENCEHVLPQLAVLIAPYMGATRKFVDFLLAFCPPPPLGRPPVEVQVSWERASLSRSLAKIYDYRSRALHAGTAFPAPLCRAPHYTGTDTEERPIGLAAGFLGSVWMAADLPMMLHVFEYIVREALRSWWASMLPSQPPLTSAAPSPTASI